MPADVFAAFEELMSKPHKSLQEVEALLTEARIRSAFQNCIRYPTTHRVGLLRRRGSGWRCFVQYQLNSNDKRIPPAEEADEMLVELVERFQIVVA